MKAAARPERIRSFATACALLALLALLALYGSATAANAVAPALSELLARIARDTPTEESFIEVRQSPLLTQPVVSSGRLEFRGPGELVKLTLAPRAERLEIAGGIATVTREGARSRSIRLDRAPELKAFLGGLGGALGGDAEALQRDFETHVTAGDDGWVLHLVPREARVRKRLTSLAVGGRADRAACIVTEEANGAMSMMLLALTLAELPETPDDAWLASRCPAL